MHPDDQPASATLSKDNGWGGIWHIVRVRAPFYIHSELTPAYPPPAAGERTGKARQIYQGCAEPPLTSSRLCRSENGYAVRSHVAAHRGPDSAIHGRPCCGCRQTRCVWLNPWAFAAFRIFPGKQG